MIPETRITIKIKTPITEDFAEKLAEACKAVAETNIGSPYVQVTLNGRIIQFPWENGKKKETAITHVEEKFWAEPNGYYNVVEAQVNFPKGTKVRVTIEPLEEKK